MVRRVGKVSYELELPMEMILIYSFFHVSMLRKFISDANSIVALEDVNIEENLSYEKVPVEISDQQVKRLRKKEIASVKVL